MHRAFARVTSLEGRATHRQPCTIMHATHSVRKYCCGCPSTATMATARHIRIGYMIGMASTSLTSSSPKKGLSSGHTLLGTYHLQRPCARSTTMAMDADVTVTPKMGAIDSSDNICTWHCALTQLSGGPSLLHVNYLFEPSCLRFPQLNEL